MGFTPGENPKAGEVTKKPQVPSHTQLLPFNTSLFFQSAHCILAGASL